jgi:flagellar hook capping protein FlgD
MRANPNAFVRYMIVTGLVFAAGVAHPDLVRSAPTLGFRESWPGMDVAGWGGGASNTNPGTGGLDGASDGYLRFSTPNNLMHKLGASSFDLPYAGDWVAAGITQVRLWLNDVGVDDPLEMHFAIGNGVNFWQYNPGFLPPNNQWGMFTVNLSSGANWTRIIGTTGTFTAALQGADRVLVRHDRTPYSQFPDDIDADVGLDDVLLTNGVAGVEPGASVTHPLLLAPPAPNPSRGPVALSLETFDAGSVKIQVVDAAGRLVRQAELAGGRPGTRIWTWDGRDAVGRLVPAGVYRALAVGQSGGMSQPLVRVR